MFLIALSGGESAERERIASRLVSSGKARLAAYALYPPMSRKGAVSARQFRSVDGVGRSRILADALDGLESKPQLSGGLVIVHCLSEEETQLVRESGGVIWHVYGHNPSTLVPIRREDRMVTPDGNSFAHVLEPLEALSEYMLAMGLAARKQARG